MKIKNEVYFINLTNYYSEVRRASGYGHLFISEFIVDSVLDYLYRDSRWSNHHGQYVVADRHFPNTTGAQITDVMTAMTKMSRLVDDIVRGLNKEWGIFSVTRIRAHDDDYVIAIEEIGDYRIEQFHALNHDELLESSSISGSSHSNRYHHRKAAQAARKEKIYPKIKPVDNRSVTWKTATTQLKQPDTVRSVESHTAKVLRRNKEREKRDDKSISNSDHDTRVSQRRI